MYSNQTAVKLEDLPPLVPCFPDASDEHIGVHKDSKKHSFDNVGKLGSGHDVTCHSTTTTTTTTTTRLARGGCPRKPGPIGTLALGPGPQIIKIAASSTARSTTAQ